MYFILFAITIGVIIGAFTNMVAIKMLFRPYKPWSIAGWQIPFTPGLIPKRRGKIAEQLGYMVENYLFTAKGMKSLLKETGAVVGIYEKLLNKLKESSNESVGKILTQLLSDQWKTELKGFSREKLQAFIDRQKNNEDALESIISEKAQKKIKEDLEGLSVVIISQLKGYIHTIEGKRMILAKMKEFMKEKKMLGYFASFIIEGNQFQDKLFIYLEQILEQEDTLQLINQVMVNKWNEAKSQSIGSIINKHEYLIEELDSVLDFGVDKLESITFGYFLNELEQRKVLERIYDGLVQTLMDKLDRVFQYLSIHKVVKDEVNRFSLKELEKMIIEIANKELKMITYMGGLLGGLIGLLQGLLYVFMQF